MRKPKPLHPDALSPPCPPRLPQKAKYTWLRRKQAPARTLDVQAQTERKTHAHLGPQRSAYAHLLALGKQGSGRAHAQRMVLDILALRERGGWTSDERASMGHALAKWQQRAAGQDARYALLGGNQNAPPKGKRAKHTLTALRVAEDVGALARQVLETGRVTEEETEDPSPSDAGGPRGR